VFDQTHAAQTADFQREEKLRRIGVSDADIGELAAARRMASIVSAQNRYNIANRSSEPVLSQRERDAIAFIPWFPLSAGSDADSRQSRSPRQGMLHASPQGRGLRAGA
jgi:pyridoxine 4-dehydrogenase